MLVSTMRAAVQRLRGQTLAGCRLCLTGLRQQAKLRLERCCLLLGAEVAALPEGATHVVAAQRTEKLWRTPTNLIFRAASLPAQRIFSLPSVSNLSFPTELAEPGGTEVAVVHPGWLLRAFVTWQRPCEQRLGESAY
ncbi:unnamed protein product [Effrenium voratum]|nr:unnamed protein product [Effrenium voratum]